MKVDRFGGLFTGRLPWVLVGLCVVLAAIGLYGNARDSEQEEAVAIDRLQATGDQAQAATAPLVELCGDPGAVGDALRSHPRNPCGLAAQVQAQPIAPARGERGETGATGDRGPMGPMGPAGPAPPCMSEPRQCRGEDGQDGRDGVDGKDGVDGQDGQDGADSTVPGPRGPEGPRGPAGGSCGEGETREPYTYPDGVSGSRCVGAAAPPPAAEDAPPDVDS